MSRGILHNGSIVANGAGKLLYSDNNGLGTWEVDRNAETNSVSLLPVHSDTTATTESGITWSCDDGVFTISGTAASAWFENLEGGTSVVPEWFLKGRKVYIDLSKSGSNSVDIYLRILAYNNGTSVYTADFNQNTEYTIPSDNVDGVIIRLYVRTGVTVSGTIKPMILTAYTNLELTDYANDIDKSNSLDSIDLIPRMPNGDTTKNGITFTSINGSFVVDGTAESSTYLVLAGSSTSIPSGATKGLRYFLKVNLSGTGVRVRITYSSQSSSKIIYDAAKTTSVIIPNDAVGFEIALFVVVGATVDNASISVGFTRALTNYELSNYAIKSNPGPMLTIIDDDGAIGFYTDLLPLIKSKNVPIATSVIGSRVGSSASWMTWAQIEECFSFGAEVLNHTYAHYGEQEETRSVNEIRMDYQRNCNLLSAHGIPTGDILIYPGGSVNLEKVQIAAKRFASAGIRSNGNKINKINEIDPFYIDRYRIDTDYQYDVDDLKELIDKCKTDGGWMIWMIHTSGSDWTTYSAAQVISTCIDYALTNSVPIVSTQYGIEEYVKRRSY